MNRKRIFIFLLAVFFMASPIYASIPDSIIIGNKAYDIRYIFNDSNSSEIKDCLKDYKGNVYYRMNNQTGGRIYKLPENTMLTDDEESALPQITYKALDGRETLYGSADGEAFDTATANVTFDTNTNSKKIQLVSTTAEGVSKYKIDGTDTEFNIGDILSTSTTDSTVVIDLLDSNSNVLFKGTLNILSADTEIIFNIKEAPSPNRWFIFGDDNKTKIIGLTDEGINQNRIVIPDSVTEICQCSFNGCTGLSSLIIPDTVTSIDYYAFFGCSKLNFVALSNSVTSISDSAFSGCPAMTVKCTQTQWKKFKSKFPNCSDQITQDSWFTFLDSTKTTITGLTAEGKKHTKVVIPNTVKRVGAGAFNGCTELASITIPNSVTNIGDFAFVNCSSLASITMPDSIISIGNKAFDGCPAMMVKCSQMQWDKFGDSFPIGSGQPSPDSWFVFSDSSKSSITGLSSEGKNHNSIIIPDSVTKIGRYAFYGCKGLTSVNIPDSVTDIGFCAFEDCQALSSIIIPNSVTNIGQQAFYNCTAIKLITIPASVKNIGEGLFARCKSLTSIKVNPSNLNYCDIDGVLYNKDKTNIIQYPAGKIGDSYIIPNTVASIGGDAFASCSGLTSIIIPDSVTKIGDGAFIACLGLTSINIPTSVKIIEDDAFQDCTGLTSITIPNSVTSIGDLTFAYCIKLESITIPASVTKIGYGVFSECTALSSIKVDSGNLYFCDIDGVLYNKDMTILIKHPGKMTDSSYGIPNSVTTINEWAFEGCGTLTSIIIPNSVVTVKDCAFSQCTGLISITIPASMTSIGSWVFSSCTGLKSITIPDTVTSIDNWAFNGCHGLTIMCSQTEWDKFINAFPYGSTRVNP